MITTVTTVTTVTAVAGLGISAVVSIIATISLLVFLTTRELAGASSSRTPIKIARYASIGILPLIAAFAAIVISRIIELL